MNPVIQDLRTAGKRQDERVRQLVKRLAPGADFEGRELATAATAVLERGDPPRDGIILREAARRREIRTQASVEAWEAAREALRGCAGDTFGLWFEPLELVGEHDGALLLTGPSYVRRWVARRYPELLNSVVRQCSDFDGVAFEVTT